MAKNYGQMLVETMERKGLNPVTIKSYRRAMRELCEFHNRKAPAKIEIGDVHEFQRHLIKDRNLAPNTVNRMLSAIRFFYREVLEKPEFKGAFPDMKAPRKTPQVLSESEIKRMIDALDNVLWKAVIMLTYSAGLRQGEVRALKITDIDSKRMLIHIRNGKGGKDRQALLSPVALDMLREYWKTYRLHDVEKNDQLFIPRKITYNGKRSKKLSHTAVGYFVKKAAKLAGIKKKFIHTYYGIRLQPIF